METEIFTLCDAATADQQGKLNLLGTFDTIFAPALPVTYSFCSIAIRLRFERIEQGKHHLSLHLIDDDGRDVMEPLEGDLLIEFGEGDTTCAAGMVLNLQNLKLEHWGEYCIALTIDGLKYASFPFRLKERRE